MTDEPKKCPQVKMYFVDLSEQANFAIGKLLAAQAKQHEAEKLKIYAEWVRHHEAEKRAIFEELEKEGLIRIVHYACEDCWYSCPQSAEACCDDRQGNECNCGAGERFERLQALKKRHGVV